MRLVTLLVGSVLVLATAGPGFAEDVTCKRINKMLGMGRSAEEIVTTGAGTITEDDVERCKSEKAAGAAGDAAGGAAGGEKEKAAE
jgi:hypothetical protein